MEEIKNKNPTTFEEAIPFIDKILRMSAHKWNLKAVPSVTFDDISQICRLHIWKKFHLYNQDMPIEPWISTIISNQIRNLLRNYYYSNVSVCQKCPENEQNGLCRIYGKQSSPDCPLYMRWERSKKNAFDIRLALPASSHEVELNSKPFEQLDVEKSAKALHEKVIPMLKESEKKVYILLYIEEKSEDDAAQILGYRTTEARKAGYNNFIRIKKSIMIKVKKAMEEIDIY